MVSSPQDLITYTEILERIHASQRLAVLDAERLHPKPAPAHQFRHFRQIILVLGIFCRAGGGVELRQGVLVVV